MRPGGNRNRTSLDRKSLMQQKRRKKPARAYHSRGLSIKFNPGDFLLSHAATRAVPSAPRGLTSVFGMGTGVTLSTQSPENRGAEVRGQRLEVSKDPLSPQSPHLCQRSWIIE